MGMVEIHKSGGSDPVLKVVFGVPTFTTNSSYSTAEIYFDDAVKGKTIRAASVAYRITSTSSTGTIWYDPSANKWYRRQKEGEVTPSTYYPAEARLHLTVSNIAECLSYSVTYEE
ncbi:MAG TPA: hypothetical protein VN421_05945 [Pseudoflavonifractor sp.]|nr:hypothetical protein [Pseudoflavonifractor sp.]